MEDFNTGAESDNPMSIVGIFNSPLEAHDALAKMEFKSDCDRISIICNDSENESSVKNSLKWENIEAVSKSLSEVLAKIGISDRLTSEVVNAVEEGMIIVLKIRSLNANKAQNDSECNNPTQSKYTGYWNFKDHFKSILTLPDEIYSLDL